MPPSLVETPAAPVPRDKVLPLAAVTETYDDTIRFYLNGTKVVLDTIDPEVTLLEYLRGIGLTGTKLGCAEGGCGACTVVVSQINPTTGKLYHASVNACLAPLASIDGKHVITSEFILRMERRESADRFSRGYWQCQEPASHATAGRNGKREPMRVLYPWYRHESLRPPQE